MDEIRGTVKDFTGSRLTLCQKSDTYSFDISQAELECREGLLAGADVCVIYEGQLNTTDTSSVRVLKVADAYHDRAELKEKKTYGQVQGLTENTITLKYKKTAKLPLILLPEQNSIIRTDSVPEAGSIFITGEILARVPQKIQIFWTHHN